MEYMIGMDSGGTKTEAIAYTLKGKELARCQTGFGNLLMDKEKGLSNIEEAITILFDRLGERNCQSVVIGLAGLDSGNFKKELDTYFSRYQPLIVFINDAWLSYYALVKEKDGCLVISGTGSIFIGKYHEETARVGGWGNILGDEGSGYWIAKRMIHHLLLQEDTNKNYCYLSKKLINTLQAKTVFDVVHYFYTHEKDEIAELAKIVAESANLGDEVSIEILKEAGYVLAKQAKLLISKLGFNKEVTIGITGSVLKKNSIVYHAFFENLVQHPLKITFIKDLESNTIGGYYYYKNNILRNEEC
ncbi:BadF-type ATPase [Carnobacterium iners]|uniref:BadF-type ATPase n=1 Tax=Carnobacterium iners TaxID=1073423 RepID=A0A1X7MUY0_9LACT|nr:BadF/BadG/BcrA/BcrD ATPase family protein [Carnobacterium iners]SEL21521.1 BadF-type ATPase [Carnobacterium iners]SMH28670.1 BadF-type ATPase [Carnobacterium iners]